MTAPRREPLAKKKLKEMIAFWEPDEFGISVSSEAYWTHRALCELLEARERIAKADAAIQAALAAKDAEKARESFEWCDRSVMPCDCNERRDALDKNERDTRIAAAALLESFRGTWCEPKAKDAKEGA